MTRRDLFQRGSEAVIMAAPLAAASQLASSPVPQETLWKPVSEPGIETLHSIEIKLFEVAVHPLRRLLAEQGIRNILFSGTMTTQSGKAVAMVAPVAGPRVDDYLAEGGFFAVLWVAGEVMETRLPPRLPAGVYALRFIPPVAGFARVDFVTPRGQVIRSVPAGLMLDGDDEGLLEKIKRKLLELFGSLDLLVDIKIVLGQPSDVRGSFLFFTFHLFDDP